MAKNPLDLLEVERLLGSAAEPGPTRPVTRVLDDGGGDRTLVGRIVCGYRLLGHLGSGGHSEVYFGRHEYLDTPCAIKVLRREFSGSGNVRRRFLREAQAMTRLDHPHVAKVTSYAEFEDRLCILLEYLEGQTLLQLLQPGVPLPEVHVRELGAQIASALVAIHAVGLVHRDVKPGNIMVLERGGVLQSKLLDFGIVRFLDPDDMTRLTSAGFVLGTPAFMSPEQRDGRDLGPASDCYSLGLVLFNMITGSLYSEGNQDLSKTGALGPIITKLLDADPARRPSAEEVLAWLAQPSRGSSRSLQLPLVVLFVAVVVSASSLVAVKLSTEVVVLSEPPPIVVSGSPEVVVEPRQDESPPAGPSEAPAKKVERKRRLVIDAKSAPIAEEELEIARVLAERGLRPEDVRHLEGPTRAEQIQRMEIDAMMLNARLDRILMKLRRAGGATDPVLLQALEGRYLQLRKSVAGDRAPRPERMMEAEDLEKRIDRVLILDESPRSR